MIRDEEEIIEDFKKQDAKPDRSANRPDVCFECGRSIVGTLELSGGEKIAEVDGVIYHWFFCPEHDPDWEDIEVPPENSIKWPPSSIQRRDEDD